MKVYIKNKDANLSHLVIPILELLGGNNAYSADGNVRDALYYIRTDGIIACTKIDAQITNNTEYKELDLQALNDIILGENKSKYPKVMIVSDSGSTSNFRRVVIGENPFTKRYIAVSSATSIEDINKNDYDPENITHWKYAEDIPEYSIKEITLEEISEKFNIPIENIRIKK